MGEESVKSTKTQKALRIASWVFGILFLSSGVMGFGTIVLSQKSEGLSESLISILMGLCLVPVTRNFILDKVGKPPNTELEQPILSTITEPVITNAKLTACKACGGIVSKTSRKCPHCGQGYPGTPKWAYALSALLVIGLPTSCVVSIMNTEPRVIDVNTDLSRAGYHHCATFVKETLQSPATAKFPDIDTKSWKVDGQQIYTLKSIVDAQNAFGVSLRTNWRCKIEFIGKSEYDIQDWKLLEISVGTP